MRRRDVLAGAGALAFVRATHAVARPASRHLPPRERMMNAVALGFIDQEGLADAIPALRAFISACVEKGQTCGYLPGVAGNKRGYRFEPITTWYKHPERGLLIPPDFTLIGDDPGSSRFFLDPSVFDRGTVDWPAYSFIFYSSGSSLQNLGFDGQRGLVNGGAETRFGSCFIKGAGDACRGAVFKNLLMTGNLGGLQETFCLSTSSQEDGALFENVRCVDNNGSGMSLNGDMPKERKSPGTGLNRNIRVIGCEGSRNTWQGITAYGCRDTLIEDFVALSNGAAKRWAGNGVNLEWTYGMHIAGGTFRGNVGGGIGGYGDNDAVLLDGDFRLRGNNTLRARKSAEIAFAKGAWWSQAGGPLSGLLRSMVIRGGAIEPLLDPAGDPLFHLSIDSRDTTMVTYPAEGPPAVPRVRAADVKALATARLWHLTEVTDRSCISVS